MYANKVSIAVSEKEAFIQFECIGPKFDDDDKIVGSEIIEKEKIVMSHEMLFKIKSLINDLEQKGIEKD